MKLLLATVGEKLKLICTLRAAVCAIFGVREDRKRLKTSVGMGRSSVLSVHSLKSSFPTSRVRALIRRTRFLDECGQSTLYEN